MLAIFRNVYAARISSFCLMLKRQFLRHKAKLSIITFCVTALKIDERLLLKEMDEL